MEFSVEISMYPLKEGYKEDILAFIKRLKSYPQLIVESNGMSTQVFGAFEEVFPILQNEMQKVYQADNKSVFILKCVNTHLQK